MAELLSRALQPDGHLSHWIGAESRQTVLRRQQGGTGRGPFANGVAGDGIGRISLQKT